MAVEAHVDPGVATAAEAAQEHGDGEGHVGGICRRIDTRSLRMTKLDGTWERVQDPIEQRRKLSSQRGERTHLVL